MQSPRKSLSTLISFSFHFLRESGLFNALRRERPKNFFRVLLFATLPGVCPARKRSRGGTQRVRNCHMLWLESFAAIEFPGADSIISILCGTVCGRRAGRDAVRAVDHPGGGARRGQPTRRQRRRSAGWFRRRTAISSGGLRENINRTQAQCRQEIVGCSLG
jgi:hypothetical protein